MLEKINSPEDIKALNKADLQTLADDVRNHMIEAVAQTGGHLGAGLGVVELTTAIHYVFNTPDDRLIWDVGHQAYPHKILTGRKERMSTIRQGDGLSGFTKRSESEYDPFGAAHSSTSISAGLGMAVASALKGEERNVVCVIGDGAMSAGMAYEAMNNAGAMNKRLIVILNDNEMSIAPPVGAMSAYLSRIMSSKGFRGFREQAKKLIEPLPKPIKNWAAKTDEYTRGLVAGGTLFEEMGFYYIGPVDGHDLEHLVPILENVRDGEIEKPVLIHAITQKGKGYAPAESSADKMHGVSKFNVVDGMQAKKPAGAPKYQNVFGQALIREAEQDERIVAITAAMPSGTGVNLFENAFPERSFDVGIAEQHAVTFAAGMASEGMKPFAAIYSTFLQRAYDQIVHDVCIQNLPVRFAMDRAGQVGADGATHAGSFDIAYLGCLPNMVMMAPSNEADLVHMVHTMSAYDESPSAVRYPRGEGIGIALPEQPEILEIGRGKILTEGTKIALLGYGERVNECLKAAEMLEAQGLSTTVADARFAKPLDTDLVERLAGEHEVIITVEDGAMCGFGAIVMGHLSSVGRLDQGCKVRAMHLPDIFIDQDTPYNQYEIAGLNAHHIMRKAMDVLGFEEQILKAVGE